MPGRHFFYTVLNVTRIIDWSDRMLPWKQTPHCDQVLLSSAPTFPKASSHLQVLDSMRALPFNKLCGEARVESVGCLGVGRVTASGPSARWQHDQEPSR